MIGGLLVFISKKETAEALSAVTYLVTFGAILAAHRFTLQADAKSLVNLLGDLSYPLYLFHLPLMILFFMRFGVARVIPLF